MKPLNNIERKAYRLKFIGMYSISIVLIILVLSAFLEPAPSIKTVSPEKEKPVKEMIKTVYVTKGNAADNNFQKPDSLKAVIVFNRQKIDSLNSFIQIQRDSIIELQKQASTINKPLVNIAPDKNETAKLKKKIEFYDWALRSQIAVTNTLTKENNKLKQKVDQLGKSNK